jgi:hypothetical protein
LLGPVDAMLACLLDVLGLRKIEPVRERVTGGSWAEATWLLAAIRVAS